MALRYENRRRPIKGGKVEVKYLNKLLNESYKNKIIQNTMDQKSRYLFF